LAAALAAITLVFAACGEADDSGSGGSDSGTSDSTVAAETSASSSTTSSSTTTTDLSKLQQSTIDFGVQYTGGKAGEADMSLEPVTVGLVYQEGGTPSFPEMGATADATVKFINEHLGGIDGHPLALKKCTMQSEEDGQKCGAELVDADVPIVSQGLAVIGNASLYKTFANKFPTLIGSTSTPADSTAPGVYSLSGGGLAVIYAMAQDAKNLNAGNVALVSVGNVGGKYTMEKIAVPALDRLGVKHGKTVYYADEATTPDIVSAVQAAGGPDADAIFFDPSTPQQCVSLWDAMHQLGIDKPVIATPICNADTFIEHTGGKPEGWRIWGFGTNPRVEDDPESKVFNNVMESYGAGEYRNIGFAPQEMRDILTIATLGNKIGYDQISGDAYKRAVLDFQGPAFMSPGPMHCADPIDPNSPAICGEQAVGVEFKGGSWVTLPAITNKMGSGA